MAYQCLLGVALDLEVAAESYEIVKNGKQPYVEFNVHVAPVAAQPSLWQSNVFFEPFDGSHNVCATNDGLSLRGEPDYKHTGVTVIKRRFCQFEALRQYLVNKYPEIPYLPAKTVGRSLEEAHLKYRLRMFDCFVKELAKRRDVMSDRKVVSFFEMEQLFARVQRYWLPFLDFSTDLYGPSDEATVFQDHKWKLQASALSYFEPALILEVKELAFAIVGALWNSSLRCLAIASSDNSLLSRMDAYLAAVRLPWEGSLEPTPLGRISFWCYRKNPTTKPPQPTARSNTDYCEQKPFCEELDATPPMCTTFRSDSDVETAVRDQTSPKSDTIKPVTIVPRFRQFNLVEFHDLQHQVTATLQANAIDETGPVTLIFVGLKNGRVESYAIRDATSACRRYVQKPSPPLEITQMTKANVFERAGVTSGDVVPRGATIHVTALESSSEPFGFPLNSTSHPFNNSYGLQERVLKGDSPLKPTEMTSRSPTKLPTAPDQSDDGRTSIDENSNHDNLSEAFCTFEPPDGTAPLAMAEARESNFSVVQCSAAALGYIMPQHLNRVTALEYQPKRHLLFSGSSDRSIKIHDLRQHLFLAEIHAHTAVTALLLRSTTLFVGCIDGSLMVYDVTSPSLPVLGHVYSSISHIVTLAYENPALTFVPDAHRGSVRCMVAYRYQNASNVTLVTGSSDGSLGFWIINDDEGSSPGLQTLTLSRRVFVAPDKHKVTCLTVCDGEEWLAAGTSAGVVMFVAAALPHCRLYALKGHVASLKAISWDQKLRVL